MEENTYKSGPVIGISGSSADSASVRAMFTQVATVGAVPLFLGNHYQRDAAEDIKKIDGLIVMGNNSDIDPSRYGSKDVHAKTQPESKTPEGKARADYEYSLMEKAIDLKMPLLGVCGGMQRINIIAGGDLHQHLPDMLHNEDHAQQEHNIAPFIPVQPVHLVKDSMLAKIGNSSPFLFVKAPVGQNKFVYEENSMHHQGVKTVGEGLRPAAYSEDKMSDGTRLVEAIEASPKGPYKDQFILGVQWHPEFSANDLGAKIAHHFRDEAQQFAIKNKRTHPAGEAAKENRLSAGAVIKRAENSPVSPGGMVYSILRERDSRRSTFNR